MIFFVSCTSDKSSSQPGANTEFDYTLLGGGTTIFDKTSGAFSREPPGLTIDDSRMFFRGRAFFRDPWVTAPASTKARDGLGPHFNARSCEACHVDDGRGRPPIENGEAMTSMLLRISVPGANEGEPPLPVPGYGTQIQNFATPGNTAEGFPIVGYEIIQGSYADGETYELRKPIYSIINPAYGDLPANIEISPRVAPSMIGLGLLEAIAASDILSLTDPEDENRDGISGRVNYVRDVETGELVIGRFGWKGNQPNIRQQTAGAFLGDIGITSSVFPEENCREEQTACIESENGGSPELIESILDSVTFYSLGLAVPAQRESQDEDVLAGAQLFQSIGCDSCHRSTWITTASKSSDSFSEQKIHPFTDLLLHDMGDGLADNRPDHLASGREWRTPPLWGIGLQETVNGHLFLLHDGRARGFAEAILWHGGEASAAQQTFLNLKKEQRNQLIKFLESL
ncbi:MAG: thiol oxidoreductase [Pseudobacteriovorax sp.]|nr:thiol oxidoreductase [Pseudobacteriovorax sp.]